MPEAWAEERMEKGGTLNPDITYMLFRNPWAFTRKDGYG